MTEFNFTIQNILPGKRLSQVHDVFVITDKVEYS